MLPVDVKGNGAFVEDDMVVFEGLSHSSTCTAGQDLCCSRSDSVFDTSDKEKDLGTQEEAAGGVADCAGGILGHLQVLRKENLQRR